VPTQSQYWDAAVPAVHVNVTVDDVSREPGTGEIICASGPGGGGVAVGVRVLVAVAPTMEVEVDVLVGVAVVAPGAAPRFSAPLPYRLSAPTGPRSIARPWRNDCVSAGPKLGLAWRTSTAAAAMCGEAADVPAKPDGHTLNEP
jgi:hypothetical protein